MKTKKHGGRESFTANPNNDLTGIATLTHNPLATFNIRAGAQSNKGSHN